ncbi:3-dehydroquinate synthase [Bengtsoniella intestinalis]|uniref:3-dehydroquinate synthase n=1 Tax=Bengtsoniella intestinalis TaxID=3073143 RepID=UPI00391F0667
MTHTITVNVPPTSYDVTIGSGVRHQCGEILRPLLGDCRVAIITDTTVAPLYLSGVRQSLETAGFQVCAMTFPAGEAHKNMTTLTQILEFLATEQLSRNDCVIALGGGVVGDMAGFAAGCFLRGIRYVQMPTTALSAIDSSVGGKTAIDLSAGKNLAGLFLQPTAVICDTECLQSLPRDILADGFAEGLKTGVLVGGSLFETVSQGLPTPEGLAQMLAECVAYKGGVVERDEREMGERKLLNLGHTPAHAIELCSNFGILHGHAVAIGTAMMARAAVKRGVLDVHIANMVVEAIAKSGLPITTHFDPEQLAEAALHDKKRAGDTITVVLPHGLGDCRLHKLPITELAMLFAQGLED